MSNLKQGWLSPLGELYECGSYDHIDAADKIMRIYKYSNITPHTGFSAASDDILRSNGWVYIGISSWGCHEWRIGWKNFLTESQKAFLKPYFDDTLPVNEFAAIRYKEET